MHYRSSLVTLLLLTAGVCSGQAIFGRGGPRVVEGVPYLLALKMHKISVPGPNWSENLILRLQDANGRELPVQPHPLKLGKGPLTLSESESKVVGWYLDAAETAAATSAVKAVVFVLDGKPKPVQEIMLKEPLFPELQPKEVLAAVSNVYVLQARGKAAEGYEASKAAAAKFETNVEVLELHGDVCASQSKLSEAAKSYISAFKAALDREDGPEGPSHRLQLKIQEIQNRLSTGG